MTSSKQGMGASADADRALAVPATPLRVDGPAGFDPSRIMQEFYVSRHYNPKVLRPADTVQAAIAFTLDRYVAGTRAADLALALDYALTILEKFEPGDSRAVSDELVSMAAIACDCANEECREILRTAIAIGAASAGETAKTGSTEGESAGPQDIAQKGSQ